MDVSLLKPELHLVKLELLLFGIIPIQLLDEPSKQFIEYLITKMIDCCSPIKESTRLTVFFPHKISFKEIYS